MTGPELPPADLVRRFQVPADEGAAKTCSLAAAIREHVRPRDTVHVAYSDARPNAALLELARAFADEPAHLTLVTAGLVSVQHALIELGVVDRVIASFAGENFPVARPNPALGRALRSGRVTIENWSLWSLIARLAAGALGVSHFPVRSLAGSDIGREASERGEFAEVELGDGPATGMVAALRPDVVLMQGAVADAHGNVVLAAPYGEGHWGALAARRGVIACVERIVSTAEIRSLNTRSRIPGHLVLAVCEVPFGAHPYALNSPGLAAVSGYVEDEAFVLDTYAASKRPESFRAWIDEWVLGVADHEGYLGKLGEGRLERLASAAPSAGEDAWIAEFEPGWLPHAGASRSESQVVATARQLGRRVREESYEVVLAGVGLANLASWSGVGALHEEGFDVDLIAEIGLYGFAPRPGEPFIFASRNVPTNKILTDVMTVLGTLIGGPRTRSIGIVGAGQVDSAGNVNSSYSDAGDFIVGSGGANDVLSAADEVIVTVAHAPQRLVASVPYVTGPGKQVRSIVTDLGVFERGEDDAFALTAYLPAAGEDEDAAVRRIRACTGWDVAVAEELRAEPPPTADELRALRVFDPASRFLRDDTPQEKGA